MDELRQRAFKFMQHEELREFKSKVAEDTDVRRIERKTLQWWVCQKDPGNSKANTLYTIYPLDGGALQCSRQGNENRPFINVQKNPYLA